MSFELEFRGALWRYLKREGHDVDRIKEYHSDRDDGTITVWFSTPEGHRKIVDVGPIEYLMRFL